MKSRCTILFMLLGMALTCHAQDTACESFFFKKVTHSFMPAITSEYFFFSNDDMIWFSTAKGLASFDGSELLHHNNLKQATDYALTRVASMLEDKLHNFYIITPLGFFYYDRKKETFSKLEYPFKNPKEKKIITYSTLYQDPNGLIYLGSMNDGLFIYDPFKKLFEHINLDNSTSENKSDRYKNTVSSFAANAKNPNQLWVGTFHGIYTFDKQKKQFSQHFEIVISKENIYSNIFLKDRQGIDIQKMDVENDSTIWFNSWVRGFGKYNTNTGKVHIVFGWKKRPNADGTLDGYITPKFIKSSEGKYLLGIFNGPTAELDTRTNTARFFNVSEMHPDIEQTRYVDKDHQGNIWVLQRGFLYVSLPPALRLQHREAVSDGRQQPELRGMFFDSTANLMYGTYLFSTGINVYNPCFQLLNILPTLAIRNVYNYGSGIDRSITKDGAGRFWTAGWKVQVLLPGEKIFTAVEKKFPSLKWIPEKGEFADVVTTRDGHILLKKSKSHFYLINQYTLKSDSIFLHQREEVPEILSSMQTFYDPQRNLLYLIGEKDIVQYNLDSKKLNIISNTTLFGNAKTENAYGIPELDAQGNIWFYIEQYGIRIFNPVTFRCIDSIKLEEKGLLRRSYDQMKCGPGNYMFLHYQNGIVIYDYKKQQSFFFDNTNGLSSPENRSFLSSNGNLIIGQRGGFDFFKIAYLDQYTPHVNPWLNTIIADSIIFSRITGENNEPIQLTHLQNTISFSFSALEYFFPERIEYEYQLWPVDKFYKKADFFNRNITYSKLRPGKYIFRLKAQMEGGHWDQPASEYSFEIIPAFWQTIWFQVICATLAICIIFYLFWWRVASIRKKEKLKMMHERALLELEAKALSAQMNPHFIFNSLNSIKSLINKNENETAVNYLTVFSKLIRTLFQNSDKREISLYEEIETCKFYTEIEKMRFGEKLEFNFDIDKSIDLKDITVPALIIQPFIENAIWHGMVPKAGGGTVNISIKNINGFINCIIDDSGIGRETSKKFKSAYESTYESRGIGLTKTRLHLDKLLNNREDKITIIDKKDASGKPEGTKVIITFKIQEN